MKKINRIKLALDILMLLVLLLMYRKNVLGLSFHEIGGLAFGGLFIIHKLLNGKWIRAVTGRLFSSKTAWRCKVNWVIDFLLLVCFVVILLSGIEISQVLFEGERGQTLAKTAHYGASALALVLIGAHMGLHYESIIMRTPARKLPLTFRRIAAVVMSAVILGFGVYQMTATSFLEWIGNLRTDIQTNETLPAGNPDETDLAAFDDGHEDGADAAGDEEAEETRPGRGGGARDGSGGGVGNQGQGGNTVADPAAIGGVLLSFLSITLAFATVVAWIDGVQQARKRSKRIQCKIAT